MPNISMNKDAHKFAPVMLDVIPLMGLDQAYFPGGETALHLLIHFFRGD